MDNASILDAFVELNKTQMSDRGDYACDMKDTRHMLAVATKRLIGPGKPFRSARELAMRAQTRGYVDNAESFARNISRVLKEDHDAQMSTMEAIARTAGLKLSDFLQGEASPTEFVKSSISDQDGAQTVESINSRKIRLIAESLTRLSSEMLDVIEHLVEIDRQGGKAKSLVLGDIQMTLQLFPIKDSETGKKEANT